ncbi:MAG: ribosome biogenesis factor YjgA [Desulfatiglandales bacterium]
MNEDEQKSRSQLKREMLALQKMGERLVGLSPVLLEKMDLPAAVKDAVVQAQGMKRHGARRRQLQFIGALMRKIDPEPIQDALDRLDRGRQKEAWAFKETEVWRDRLVGGDDGLMEEIVHRFGDADRHHLRRLVLSARQEKEKGRPPKASRALFRYLRSLFESQDPPADNA